MGADADFLSSISKMAEWKCISFLWQKVADAEVLVPFAFLCIVSLLLVLQFAYYNAFFCNFQINKKFSDVQKIPRSLLFPLGKVKKIRVSVFFPRTNIWFGITRIWITDIKIHNLTFWWLHHHANQRFWAGPSLSTPTPYKINAWCKNKRKDLPVQL